MFFFPIFSLNQTIVFLVEGWSLRISNPNSLYWHTKIMSILLFNLISCSWFSLTMTETLNCKPQQYWTMSWFLTNLYIFPPLPTHTHGELFLWNLPEHLVCALPILCTVFYKSSPNINIDEWVEKTGKHWRASKSKHHKGRWGLRNCCRVTGSEL